jgi:hypothetical protein
MSKLFLNRLNGQNNGIFKRYIRNLTSSPRIAWYPSAGEDFRSLLYLNPDFSRIFPSKYPEPQEPDLFLFTDYFPWSFSNFLNSRILYSDSNTIVQIDEFEKLPALNLELHDELVHFPEGGRFMNQVFFMKVRVQSTTLGEFVKPVLYVFAENETFYAKIIVPNQPRISHIIHVRYGGGFGGGGNASGAWLLNILDQIQCEVFITDGHHHWQSGDDFALNLCPEIPKECNVGFIPIRTIYGRMWSNHGDVTWNIIPTKD